MFKKLFNYFFKKPDVKKGDTLAYYNYVCINIYFDWGSGLWFLQLTDEFDISYNVEKYYKEKLTKGIRNDT